MKNTIKKLLGGLLKKQSGEPKKSATPFKSSEDYWDKRYRSGGNSGAGSYDNLAEFKAEVINSFLKNKQISTVIEFGCGDGNQLKYLNPEHYLGLDVSEKAIEMCLSEYAKDEKKEFKLMEDYNNEKAELSMSLDVIYHLIEDDVFENYMNKLFNASEKYVIIYSSNTADNSSSAVHVKHRKFTDWIEHNKGDFKLLEFIPNKYPFDGKNPNTSFADFYIFEKEAG